MFIYSADVYHVLWINAEKHQNYETALFSADYLWDFNPGYYPRFIIQTFEWPSAYLRIFAFNSYKYQKNYQKTL